MSQRPSAQMQQQQQPQQPSQFEPANWQPVQQSQQSHHQQQQSPSNSSDASAAAGGNPSSPHDPSWFEPSALEAAAHAAIDAGDDAVVAQFLMLLEAHRARCERQQLYVEAALVADKVSQLRAHEDSRRAHSLAVRHLAERLDLEEAHILEFDEFGAAWEAKLTGPQGFDAETAQRMQQLKARHAAELEQWTAQEQEQLLLRPKFSKQLLQLRSKQESLARSRDYVAAERVRAQAAQLERVELDALKASWGARAHQKRARFLEGQAKEQAGFALRRAEERAQLEQRKRGELRSLVVQKYSNLKGELERSQTKERVRLGRMAEMGISDSVQIREEAPRRANAPQNREVGPDQAAAWNAGLAAGAAMARNYNATAANAAAPSAAAAAAPAGAATMPQQRSAAASASDLHGASASPYAVASAAAAAAAAASQRGPRRSIESEQEAMLRGEPISVSNSSSSAAEVPTISSALFARHTSSGSSNLQGGGSSFMPPPPLAPAAPLPASSFPSQAQLLAQQQYAQTQARNQAQAAAAAAPAPSTAQLLQQKHAAMQQQQQQQHQQQQQQSKSFHSSGAFTARTGTSTSYDPLGTARPRPVPPAAAAAAGRQRLQQQQQQQPLTTRTAASSKPAAAASGFPAIQRPTGGSGNVTLPATSRYGLAAASALSSGGSSGQRSGGGSNGGFASARFNEHKESQRY